MVLKLFDCFPLAAGCKRTPKAELIRMDIVKKVKISILGTA